MLSLQPSTWNALGLGVAATFIGLGTAAASMPHYTAHVFGCAPPSTEVTSSSISTSTSTSPGQRGADVDVAGLVRLMAARDLTIGVTMACLAGHGENRATGILILSSMLLCGVDIFTVWQRRRWLE